MSDALTLDPGAAAQAFGEGYFNLIRRGGDGSLKLSADHWRLDSADDRAFCFSAREADAPSLQVALADVARVMWERLPKQQARSQVRFQLHNGDVWTFSGSFDESALPPR